MKKLGLILLFLFSITINLSAQFNRYYYSGLKLYKRDNIFFRNNSFMIASTVGLEERRKWDFMFGLNTEIFGLVANTGLCTGRKGDYYYHFGYNFPFSRYFSFAPLIGKTKRYGFDYGGLITVNIPVFQLSKVSIPITLTRHAACIGIGFTINTYK